MKVRVGFVSNSSSSSYIFVSKNPDISEGTRTRSFGEVLEHVEYLGDPELEVKLKKYFADGKTISFVFVPYEVFNETEEPELKNLLRKCGLTDISY